jgi:hypothetical protein
MPRRQAAKTLISNDINLHSTVAIAQDAPREHGCHRLGRVLLIAKAKRRHQQEPSQRCTNPDAITIPEKITSKVHQKNRPFFTIKQHELR